MSASGRPKIQPGESAIAKLVSFSAAMDNTRAKILEIDEGTSEVQRMLIARELRVGG